MKKILFGFVMFGLLGGSLLVSAHEQQDKLATEKVVTDKAAQQAALSAATNWEDLKDIAGTSSYLFAALGAMLGTSAIIEDRDIQGRRVIWVPIAAASWFRLYQGWQKMKAWTDSIASRTAERALSAQQDSEKHSNVQDKLAAGPTCSHCVGLSAWQSSPQTAEHELCAQSRQAISDMMTD